MSDTKKWMEYDANKKSVIVAYLLLWLTACGHRFYLGKHGSASAMLCLLLVTFVGIGLFEAGIETEEDGVVVAGLVLMLVSGITLAVCMVVDLFRVGGMVRKHNNDLIQSIESDKE